MLLAITATVLLTSCETKKDPFLVSNGAIGLLSKSNKVSQLDSIFALDSVVFTKADVQNFISGGKIEVFDSAGNLLLILDPKTLQDKTSEIAYIQVMDNRFSTNKGLSVNSTYKTIKDNYIVSTIESTLSSVIVSLEGSDIYVIIDKKELPENLRYTQNKIETTQIPDEAVFKYFMIGWDSEVEKEEEENISEEK